MHTIISHICTRCLWYIPSRHLLPRQATRCHDITHNRPCFFTYPSAGEE